ncbi:hypothetical protein AGR1C_Cc40334 [Agrobacterium fabacearum TT111]|nr:hypothetical protein AGR1C_Cc40334 [Agrobacterium fabacearum TT111]
MPLLFLPWLAPIRRPPPDRRSPLHGSGISTRHRTMLCIERPYRQVREPGDGVSGRAAICVLLGGSFRDEVCRDATSSHAAQAHIVTASEHIDGHYAS